MRESKYAGFVDFKFDKKCFQIYILNFPDSFMMAIVGKLIHIACENLGNFCD